MCTSVYGGFIGKPKIQRLSILKPQIKEIIVTEAPPPIKTEIRNNGCQTDPETRIGWC